MSFSLFRCTPAVRSWFLLCFGLLGIALAPAPAQGWSWRTSWEKITDEERALSAPKIDPEAGAEILLMEMEVDDSDRQNAAYRHYVRIKVFNERGVEDLNTIDIEAFADRWISDLGGRVIKPDGSILTVDKKDMFSRETYRYGDQKVRTFSFSPPGLEPGCIVEYQWSETVKGSAHGKIFTIARNLPTHVSRFRFRPLPDWRFRFTTFLFGETSLEKAKNDYWEAELRDLPGFPEEPFLPPVFDIQPWITIFYTDSRKSTDPEVYWKEVSRELVDLEKKHSRKGAKELKRMATELTMGADTPRQALKQIYQFCTREIVNTRDEESGLTAAELEKMKDNEYAADTLKNRYGSSWDINYLFFALASNAGLEAKLVFANNRYQIDWQLEALTYKSTPDLLVAVKLDDQWEYFDPGEPFIPFGQLHWANTSVVAAVSNPKKGEHWKIGLPAPDTSLLERNAKLAIDEEGTLTGSVSIRYTGQRAVSIKKYYAGENLEECEKYLERDVKRYLPAAKLTNIEFINLKDRELDPVIKYNIEVPSYADVTGQRIFLRSSFFEQGTKPVFTRENRLHDIRFRFGWETRDTVMIGFPDNYAVEEGVAPVGVSDVETFFHSVLLGLARNSNTVVLKRTERVGALHVHRNIYAAVKQFFDAMHEQDQHILILRKVEEQAEPSEPAPVVTETL